MKEFLLLFCLGCFLSLSNSLFSQNDCPSNCTISCNIGQTSITGLDINQCQISELRFIEIGFPSIIPSSGDTIDIIHYPPQDAYFDVVSPNFSDVTLNITRESFENFSLETVTWAPNCQPGNCLILYFRLPTECSMEASSLSCDNCNIGKNVAQITLSSLDGEYFAPVDGFWFIDPNLESGDTIELSETEFENTDFLNFIAASEGGCDGSQHISVRRPSRINRGPQTNLRSRNSRVETIAFTSRCSPGNCLILNVRILPDLIPTLSQWSLIIFGLLILNLGIGFILKKNRILITP